MDRDAFLPGRKLILGTAVVVATVVAAPPSAFSADRVVLMEQFTATWCTPCNNAAPVIGGMIDNHGANGDGTFAVVEYHVSDPPWSFPWGESRADFYNVSGIPHFQYDGVTQIIGYPGPVQAAYENRLAIPAPMEMDIIVVETAPRTYNVTVELCLDPGESSMNVTVYTVMLEDHYPPGEAVARNTFRWVAPTSDLRLTEGVCELVVNEFTNIAPMTSDNNLKVVAWAQTPNPSPPAEVHQAAVKAFPFAPPCPWDCQVIPDGAVNVGDFLALLSQWGNTGGSCDYDGGGVGSTDFLALLAHWGPCPVN